MDNKQNEYIKLKKDIVTYKDLQKDITLNDQTNNEQFVWFENENGKVLVRESVKNKLKDIDKELSIKGLSIKVFQGYRSLKEQVYRFEEVCKKLQDGTLNDEQLFEKAHNFIAVPKFAGHPTGGAVDVGITSKATRMLLDFGCDYCDFENPDILALSPFVNNNAKENRKLLRNLMLKYNFAPFNGEWWHFSYGDREWAIFYKKDNFLYNQQEIY